MTDRPFTRGPARRPAPVDADGAMVFDVPAARPQAPATAQEARQRYINRYLLPLMRVALNAPSLAEPQTPEEWLRTAEATRDLLRAQERARAWVGTGED